MSDSRFHLEVKFQIYGQTYEWDSSLNYFDRGDGMDDRIFDWFVSCYQDAYCKFNARIYEEQKKSKAAEKEREERDLLAKLKAKYEGNA